MSLDKNLFTLNVRPIPGSLVVELVDPNETVHYRKERTEGPGGFYQFDVFDPLSGSMLASVTSPSPSSKTKTIELHNPSVPIELKFSGIFTFKWSFKWEDHEFEWKREECVLIRKPDPPVLVAVTKEPPGKLKTKTVQILDYNLNRFDIFDRKGLEVVMLSALLSFQDYAEEKAKDPELTPQADESSRTPVVKSTPPPLPPKPEKTGAELIASMQAGELGEIIVSEKGPVNDYARYCANLLEGDNMLYIVLKSSSALTVPKVLEIVHQTKRIRHKEGIDEELHQYVQYDVEKKSSRVIKLDDKTSEYEPPESLVVHLSKIVMPELQPKAKETERQRRAREEAEREARELAVSVGRKGKGKETRDERKKREKEEAERDKRLKDEERELARLEKEHKKAKKGGSKPSPPRASETKLVKHTSHPRLPSNLPSSHFAAPVARAPGHTLSAPQFQTGLRTPSPHLRTASSPRVLSVPAQPHPPQRPVSAYGSFLGPPPPPPQDQRRSSSPNTLMDSIVYKFKTRGW